MTHDAEHSQIDFSDKERGYAELAAQLTGLLQGERDPLNSHMQVL